MTRSVARALFLVGALAATPVATRAQVATAANAGTGGAEEQQPAWTRYFPLVRNAFSGDRARDVVAYMDRWFRLPGNPGFDSSIVRVAGILRDAGYVEATDARPEDRFTYRIEHRPMEEPAWEPLDGALTIAGQTEPLLRFATNRNMLAINSHSTDGVIEAPLVLVGAGSPAELDSADVRGKIVLVDGSIRRAFADSVTRRGALGVLAYSMPAYTKPSTHTSSIQFSSIPYEATGTAFGIMLSYGAREALRDAMAKGPVRVRVMTRTRFTLSDELTLVAEIRGREQPDERFVFSAHVQEPGANDNASGVGTLAEMARVAAELERAGAWQARRTLTFLWGDEISSTRRFLAEDSVRTSGVHWGVSLDMVGENTALTGGTFLIEKMPDPSAVWTRGEDRHTEWGGRPLRIEDLTPHYLNDFVLARCLDQSRETGWVVRTNPFEGGSDHVPFLRAGKAGLLFWHFTDVFYHTDGDRLVNVSAATMANVGASALVSAMTLTSADGATARAIVAEVERMALDRLARERALSDSAVRAGGDREHEALILRTWTDWYVRALGTASDIETGGTSAETREAMERAAARVAGEGNALVASLPPSPALQP
ncbi:MAG TPA: M28 family peptidase [Gemmatimonadaceae bacterium]|nr:M28 family peptidase [Gemmatimonadaceae bacterium]